MIKKFTTKMRDPKERRLFYAIFGGKMIGLGLCFLVMLGVSVYFGSSALKAHADTGTATTATAPGAAATPAAPAAPAPVPDPPYCSPINTMWVLVTAFLVF